jgi:hypothetical protein
MVELFTATGFARSPRSNRSGSPCRHGTGSPRQHRLNERVSPESPVADLQPPWRLRTGFKHDGSGWPGSLPQTETVRIARVRRLRPFEDGALRRLLRNIG